MLADPAADGIVGRVCGSAGAGRNPLARGAAAIPKHPPMISILIGLAFGVGLAALLTLLFGVYTIGPTERGVVTTFGRVQRLAGSTGDDP